MSDIIDELRELLKSRGGTTDSDVNVFGAVVRAINEIEELRGRIDHMMALAGKVSVRPSYVDIAKDARHDLPVDTCANG